MVNPVETTDWREARLAADLQLACTPQWSRSDFPY